MSIKFELLSDEAADEILNRAGTPVGPRTVEEIEDLERLAPLVDFFGGMISPEAVDEGVEGESRLVAPATKVATAAMRMKLASGLARISLEGAAGMQLALDEAWANRFGITLEEFRAAGEMMREAALAEPAQPHEPSAEDVADAAEEIPFDADQDPEADSGGERQA